MSVDVIALREFYATPLGQASQNALLRAFSQLKPFDKNLDLVGIGYPVPLFDKLARDLPQAIILMPARQGALQWPVGGESKVALVDEDELPIETASVQCVVVLHLIENVSDPSQILNEIWRILVPEGKLILVATNRRGFWTRFEHTPYGNGRSFSRGQLSILLRKAKLTPSDWIHCLNFPPMRIASLIRFYPLLDRLGARFWPLFCGAYVVTATKRLYQGVPATSRRTARVKAPVIAAQGANLSLDADDPSPKSR